MQKLTFTNQRSDSFVIAYSKPFALQDLVGLSDIPVELLSNKGYKQDGQNSAGQYFQARPVSFSVVVLGDTLEEVFERRRQLLKFFSPKDQFTVIYENDYISKKFTCRVEAAPRFASTQSNPGSLHQTCAISLLCDNPYLTDIDETVSPMSIAQASFGFPLIIPDTGITMSLINTTMALINNTGDVETPLHIRFNGPTTNPKITNDTTGDYIKVNQIIHTGEILDVFTGYGEKRVEITRVDGTVENAFQYLDLSSKFFQLQVGENELHYTADSGAESAVVIIYYSHRYVGV